MSTAAGYVPLAIAPELLTELEADQPCNLCVFGTHMDPEHLAGTRTPEYQIVSCPICSMTGLRTKPEVRAIKSPR